MLRKPLEERLTAYTDRLDRDTLEALAANAPLRPPIHLVSEAEA